MKYYVNGNVLGTGCVSSGTLRTEDLGRSFCNEYHRYTTRTPDSIRHMEWWLEGDTDSLRDVGYQETTTWDELGTELLQDVFAEMEHLAPSGIYFGAHEGDGACFGWWECGDEPE